GRCFTPRRQNWGNLVSFPNVSGATIAAELARPRDPQGQFAKILQLRLRTNDAPIRLSLGGFTVKRFLVLNSRPVFGLRALTPASSLLVLSFCGSTALADASAAEKATATLMVGDAEKLMHAGRYTEACPKLADAERVDPEPATLLRLSECYD